MTRRATALVGLLLLPALTAACHSGKEAPNVDAVRTVVAGPVAAYREIAIVAGAKRVVVAPELSGSLAPLRAGRTVDAAEPLASYGLDPPLARIVYASVAGDAIVVEIGGTDFDHHFVYVVRPPDRATIELIPSGVLAPLLQKVGIELPAPS